MIWLLISEAIMDLYVSYIFMIIYEVLRIFMVFRA